MAHRGRLNVLANIVGKSYSDIFSEFEGNLDPESVQGSGDVKYHKGARGVFKNPRGATIDVSMASNPSHLEAVSRRRRHRARQAGPRRFGRATAPSVAPKVEHPYLAIVIHGDAAFAGQGVVAETLNMSQLSGYHIGGTIHIVINNQVGFTTAPESARSSFYPTDVAKMIQAPIFHVNGDDPEACARVARLAFDYRETFQRDVVLDIVCYRRFGHNEGDDPSYTQPQMYKIIDQMRSVRKIYTETLVRRGDISIDEAEAALNEFNARLQSVLDEVRTVPVPELNGVPVIEVPVDLRRPRDGRRSRHAARDREGHRHRPRGIHDSPEARAPVHPAHGLARVRRGRLGLRRSAGHRLARARGLERSPHRTGHATRHVLASPRRADRLRERTPVRAAREHGGARDSSRCATRSFREYAALGFEYGYSVEAQNTLVAWEAQFGDFANGAEIIIDNFLVAAEDKWGQHASLTMLLAPRLRGPGSRALERSHRALLVAQRAQQHSRRPAHDRRRSTSTCCAAKSCVIDRRRSSSSRPSRCCVRVQTRSPLAEFEHGSFQTVLDDHVDDVGVDHARRAGVGQDRSRGACSS